jgi:flavin reductase (DIM6/NTAB) family NADH-FMN oxidoreductase RutF
MKKTVDAFAYSNQICNAMKKGILLTTACGEQVNTMTIGWGHIGIEWGRPVFVAYVRESRYSKTLLDETGEFTVNIPVEEVDPKILGYCGTKSGRDCDKIRDMGLTLETPRKTGVPGIREFPLTLECKVLFRQTQNPELIPSDIQKRFYPADCAGLQDAHIAYYGEILDAYLITE